MTKRFFFRISKHKLRNLVLLNVCKNCNLRWSLALCIKSYWASVSSLFPHIYFVNRHVVKKEDHGITHTSRIVYRPTIKALLTKTRNQKNAICVDISLKMFLGMAKKWILWSCLFKNKLIEILIVYPEEIWKSIGREYRCYK